MLFAKFAVLVGLAGIAGCAALVPEETMEASPDADAGMAVAEPVVSPDAGGLVAKHDGAAAAGAMARDPGAWIVAIDGGPTVPLVQPAVVVGNDAGVAADSGAAAADSGAAERDNDAGVSEQDAAPPPPPPPAPACSPDACESNWEASSCNAPAQSGTTGSMSFALTSGASDLDVIEIPFHRAQPTPVTLSISGTEGLSVFMSFRCDSAMTRSNCGANTTYFAANSGDPAYCQVFQGGTVNCGWVDGVFRAMIGHAALDICSYTATVTWH